MRTLLVFLAVFSPAAAADDAASDDDFSFIEEGEVNRAKVEADRAPNANLFLEEDEEDTEMWSAPPQDSTAAQAEIDGIEDFGPATVVFEGDDPVEGMESMGPDLSELPPLGDHFPLTIGPSSLGGLVAELPVLVARNSNDLQGDLWVVADIYTNGIKIGESRHFVSPDSASETGPTYVWIKANVPLNGPSGVVEMRVFAAPPGKKEAPLFSRQAAF